MKNMVNAILALVCILVGGWLIERSIQRQRKHMREILLPAQSLADKIRK